MKFDPAKLGKLIHVLATLAALGLATWNGLHPVKPDPSPLPPTPKPDTPISLDAQYQSKAGYIVRLSAATTGKTVKWRVISGPEAQPSLQVVDSHTVDFSSPKAGKFVLQASTSVAGEVESADTEIVNGDGPTPPGPQPPTPPTPPAPIPGQGLRVLVVYDKKAPLPRSQQDIISGAAVRSYLQANCAKGPDGKTPERRFLDPIEDVSNESPVWQAAMKRKRDSLPWLIIGNGAAGYEGPLPANADAMLSLLKKYAGG